ncbi:MAG: alpha/beta hydrolase [Firmicutes bacterium]|nr:alpha/beta hydrolase [Bacillota bacterium]
MFQRIARAPICDIAYASQSERQKVDICLPRKKGGTDVVFFIHGGGWSAGDKSLHRDACIKYAKQGYAAAAMNYRFINPDLPPERQSATCADMLDDIGNAIAAVKARMIEEGYTPRKMAVGGCSAGGHLTMLYAYSRGARAAIPIAFLFPDVGPTDFTDPAYLDMPVRLARDLAPRLAGRADFDPLAMSPLHYAAPGAPPTLLRYGALDELVPLSQGTLLQAALEAAGVRSDLLVYPNSGHGLDGNADAALNARYDAKLREYFDTYF